MRLPSMTAIGRARHAATITFPGTHPIQRHSFATLNGDHVQGRQALATLITPPDADPNPVTRTSVASILKPSVPELLCR